MTIRRFFFMVLVVALATLVVHPQEMGETEMVELPEAVTFMLEAFTGDFEAYENYIHPDWQWVGNGELQFEGHEGFVNAFTFWTTAFPDIEYEVLHAIGEGDVWAISTHLTGTNTGDFEPMGIVATGNELDFYGSGFVYLEDGQMIYSEWTWDWMSWYDALGIPYASAPVEAE